MSQENQPTPVERFFTELRERLGESGWTSEFPTTPGFYWIRNYILSANPKMHPVSRLEVVRLMPEPDGFLLLHRSGDSRQWCVGDFITAEWYGPIEPPE